MVNSDAQCGGGVGGALEIRSQKMVVVHSKFFALSERKRESVEHCTCAH